MKKNKLLGGMLVAALAVTSVAGLAACGDGSGDNKKPVEKTTRIEAEHATVIDDMSISSKFDVYCVTGKALEGQMGFKWDQKRDGVVTYEFTAARAGEATITLHLASGKEFGNAFTVDQEAWGLFYCNDVVFGTPVSVKDVNGEEVTECPKEDQAETENSFIDASFKVNLVEGKNTFSWKYKTGKPCFMFDYAEIKTTCDITWTPTENELPSGDGFGGGGFDPDFVPGGDA